MPDMESSDTASTRRWPVTFLPWTPHDCKFPKCFRKIRSPTNFTSDASDVGNVRVTTPVSLFTAEL
jgi:hypothetical protein